VLEIGSLVDGKYKILNKVGQGGMSVVYLAMNEKANKQWAVKEVRKDGIKDFEVVRQGLVAETEILKKLNHPNLPSIVDVIDREESFIIIMDYIQGNSLNKALDEYGAQPQEHVIAWAKQLCDVLGYLHTRTPAIIYRDMKPANIMLKPDGNVTLIDFGTAREFKEKNLADTTCLGTVGYAAPEQFGGMGQTDARTDIYCLGATLYHLVTGMNPCEPPYEIKPIREINPALSSGLERIILKCTQRDPNDRYQSAAELMYALEHYEEIDDVYRKKQKGKLAKFITCAALTLVFAGTSVWGHVSAERAQSETYDSIVQTASSWEDYKAAILTDPTRYEAYLGLAPSPGLINYLCEPNDNNEQSTEQKLTREESSYFKELLSGIEDGNKRINVLERLKSSNKDKYYEVCYKIGEAYLDYYDVSIEKDRYGAAKDWYEKCKESDEYPAAAIYCELSECMKNIDDYSRKGHDEKLRESYKALWNKLGDLQNSVADSEDINRIKICNEIVRVIDYNAPLLVKSIDENSILQMLDSINEECQPVVTMSVERETMKKNLLKKIEKTRERILSLIKENSAS